MDKGFSLVLKVWFLIYGNIFFGFCHPKGAHIGVHLAPNLPGNPRQLDSVGQKHKVPGACNPFVFFCTALPVLREVYPAWDPHTLKDPNKSLSQELHIVMCTNSLDPPLVPFK